MKKKMLVIPGPFVPYNDTLTLLNYKRLAYLDLDFDVLAIGGKEDQGLKEELEKDNNYKKFKIKRVLDYKKMDIVRNPFNLPYFIYAYFKYKKEVIKTIKSNKYDYLYTASHPGMVHLIGKKIKKINKEIKWFASFSDPIKGSPYKNDPEVKKKSIFYQLAFNIGTFFYVGDYYEKAAINYADKLVFICKEQRDFTCSQYSNKSELIEKSIIMPLSIEPKWQMYKDLLDVKETNSKPLIASHLGRIYGLRKIDSLLYAISDLKNERLISKDVIIFNQYDEADKDTLKLIKDLNIEDVFIVNKKVTYNKSIEIMKESDILMLFDTLMPESIVQPYLPSKIAEYLVLRKPILGLCEPNSPSYRILNDYGYEDLGSSKSELKSIIMNIIDSHSNKNYSIESLFAENCNKELKESL